MLSDVRIIQLPRIEDERGNLSFLENFSQVPFCIKRVYWIYDVPGGEIRGGHAFRTLNEIIISLSGSFDVLLSDGKEERRYSMNRSYYGLFVPNMIWRRMENFSTNALAMVVVDQEFNENDYIRNENEFKLMLNEK